MAVRSAQQFLDEIAEIQAKQIREDMKRDMHVLILSVAEFAKLVRLHLDEVRKISNRSDDPDIKAQLNTAAQRNPNKLAKRLHTRFIEVLEKQLRATKGVDWKAINSGNVRLYFLEGKGRGGKVFDVMQKDIMAPIRRELVFKSKSGSLDRVLSLVIAGIDIDEDLNVNKDTSLGTYAKSKTLSGAPQSISTKSYPAKGIKVGDTLFTSGAGTQLGHGRGGGTIAAVKKLEKIREFQSNIIGLTGTWYEARQFADVIHKFDAEMKFNDVVYNIARGISGKVDISIITLEQTAANAFSGAKITPELRKLDAFLRKNAEKIVTQKGSRPIVTSIMEEYKKLFLTGKAPQTTRVNRSYKKRKVVKGKAGSSTLRFRTKTNLAKLAELLTGDSDENNLATLDIIELVNAKLTDKIRENMGKGNSKQTLNWRTGRFGKSAKLKNLTTSKDKNALLASVKYHGAPYTRFEKGGDLHKVGRDPKLIFGRSIRQILQEERIANLRRVKVKLIRDNG